MLKKIKPLLTQLNHGLVGREDSLKIALLTVLTGENLVLIGPPGTGKSLIARRIADCFAHNNSDNASNSTDSGYFEYLLTKFSTPEEIFGPLSITELKADRFKRNTAGYLPSVKIAFLDEIFKASSSILNALLTILNERIYHNGAERQNVPLQALIAASNELPSDQEELSALYDRFLVRSFVDYVSADQLLHLFHQPGEKSAENPIQLNDADLAQIQAKTTAITLEPELMALLVQIWTQHKEMFKEDRREVLSDRRLVKLLKLLKLSAATNGRRQVDLSDMFLLKNCLWNHPENAIKVRELILKNLRSCSRQVPLSKDSTIPASSASQWMPPSFLPDSAKPQIKGFSGRGTEQDPLQIGTLEDLMDLSRPEVGQQGYYFRQTADIDCTALSRWSEINFQGHYDGAGHIILYKLVSDKCQSLFHSVQENSSITRLKLSKLGLATSLEKSQISHCSGVFIAQNANHSSISACESSDFLISSTASHCTIHACQSSASISSTANTCTISGCAAGSFLILKAANHCTIRDCLAVINIDERDSATYGGIAANLVKGTLLERCLVTGHLNSSRISGIGMNYNSTPTFTGIAAGDESCTIRCCALGAFSSCSDVRWSGRISAKHADAKSLPTLENNAVLDTVVNNSHASGSTFGSEGKNAAGGEIVAAVRFTQRYFETTLHWDFNTVWQWDATNERPALRAVGLGAAAVLQNQPQPTEQEDNMAGLLSELMRANIWL